MTLINHVVLFVILFIVSFIDIKEHIIPNKIILIGCSYITAISIVQSVYYGSPAIFLNSLLGFFAGGIPLFLVIVISRGGMGAGDMKLLAMIGGFLGVKNIIAVLFLSVLIGGLAALLLLLLKLKDRKSQLAFAPFISCGAFIVVVFHDQITLFLAVYYGIAF